MADDYLRRVCESYQGEVYGEALFHELVARSRDSEQRYKWRVLGQLEAETKRRLKPLVAALGGETEEAAASLERASAHAEAWSREPWHALMAKLCDELPRYVRFFEKLEAAARAEDRELLGRVTAHERALLAFAEDEVSGRGDRSLEPVLALLEAPPPLRP